ncbi:non-ribosomal peptide synthetase, partial [Paenibacillus plantarum]|uniref:non-ribosomal peptide synthetase n=1 Tax=Paenibacillus plantarum TaxID=2654975 RepID=UPI0028AD6B6D
MNLLEGQNIKYNMPSSAILDGELDLERFRNAYSQLLARHEVLRTSFSFVGGQPVQTVHRQVPQEIEYIELQDSSVVKSLLDAVKPFDLNQAPLIRMKLVKVSEKRHILIYDIHHIIFDGISISVIVQDLLALYDGVSLTPLAIQYKDFAWWHNERLQSEELKKQEAYWLDVFSGDIPNTRIPADAARTAKRNFTAETIRFYLGKDETTALKRVASESDATLYMILLSVFSLLVSNYTNQEDIVIGSPISGRNHPDLEPLIGIFINVLAMRIHAKGSITFREFLMQTKETALQAYEHQEYPFEELVEKLNVKRDTNSHPLFNIMFALHSHLRGNANPSRQLKIKESEHEIDTATYDLTLDALETDNGLAFNLVYSNELYTKEAMQQLAHHFCNMVVEVTAAPDLFVRDIQMLSHSEKTRILEAFNPKETPLAGKTVTQLLAESLKEYTGRTAIICRNERLTYSELDNKSDRLAKALRGKGVGRDSIVAVLLPRSTDLLVAILGVLKAGGAYLPIDPDYPKDRITYMVEDSQATILLTSNDLAVESGFQGEVLRLGMMGEESDSDEAVVLSEISPHDLAYVIYTSGSTGKPKGVMVEQEALYNFLEGIPAVVNFGHGKTIAALTTVSFDIFVLETLLPLTLGMQVVIADEQEQKVPDRLHRLLVEHQVDIIQATPSRIRLMLEQSHSEALFHQISLLLVGGETFPDDLLRELRKLYSGKLYNLYGPTETTIWSMVKEMTEADKVSIGRPIQNTQVYILGPNLQVKPIGCAGDLYIGGKGVARGYYGKPELTQERFITHPFLPGERLYHTGDMARRLANGEIEYIGRTDGQLKLNGFRIEAGEVEEQLKQFSGIKEAIVKKWKVESGEYLCAYIRSEHKVDVQAVKAYLRENLPYYMVPSTMIQLERFPYTPNGKIDWNGLPRPTSALIMSDNYRVADSELEKEVTGIWQEVLGMDKIGVEDNFFDLGGNSIMLVKMHQQLEKKYPGMVDVTELFGFATISKIANRISSQQAQCGSIELKAVGLPEEYFTFKYSINPTAVMRYRVDSSVYEGILHGAANIGKSTDELLLSIFVFLLSNVTDRDVIHLSAAVGIRSELTMLTMEPFRNIRDKDDLQALIEQIEKGMEQGERRGSEEIVKLRAARGKREILAMYKTSRSVFRQSLATVFDLTLEVKETPSTLEISLEFNNRLLSEGKMKSLL